MTDYSRELRFVTYLSPGIPQAFFEAVVDHVRRTLGYERTSLRVEERVSGPEKGVEDPFSRGEADVGVHVCAFVPLAARAEATTRGVARGRACFRGRLGLGETGLLLRRRRAS